MLSSRSLTFKLESVKSEALALLSDIAVILLEGRDASAFAQAQTMNDVAALPEGHWHWNGWLDAKGRVQALFALAKVTPQRLWLLLLDQPATAFAEALRRFVLRSRVAIVVREDLGAFAEFGDTAAPSTAPANVLLAHTGAECGLDLSTPAVSRRLWVQPRGEAHPDPGAGARWREADLRHGLPRWAVGREPAWTPHMLSLDRLRAFSVKKGCYPGQEIVARTHFLGRSKRQAWWLEGEGLKAGAAVEDAQARVLGEVLEATADGRGALAVAALEAPGTVRVAGSVAAASVPLPGLARPA
ncbi:MAG: folate-binding protein YgfZ [Silanimonas sp.]|nr:MAG: folate-binding protein YgfZ [Silanimonas sp.]